MKNVIVDIFSMFTVPQVTLTDPLAEAAPLSWARHGVLSCSHNTSVEFPASSLGPEQRARYEV